MNCAFESVCAGDLIVSMCGHLRRFYTHETVMGLVIGKESYRDATVLHIMHTDGVIKTHTEPHHRFIECKVERGCKAPGDKT